MFPLPVKQSGSTSGSAMLSSRSRSRLNKSTGNPKPFIDMSSVKPFSQQHRHGSGAGGSTAFTRTTVATSSSEESRAAQSTRSARSRHSYHEPRREGRSSRTASHDGSASVGRCRSKSRPRDAAASLSMASSAASSSRSPRSPRGASITRSTRGRSHSRPRQKSAAPRGRSMSIVRKEMPDTSRGRSRPRTEIRGRSLGPENTRGRSQSRSRTAVQSAARSVVSFGSGQASRSRSRARLSGTIRKSQRESMETMEEEREEDISDKNLVYHSNAHNNCAEAAPDGRRSKGRGRSLSRKRNSAVNLLEAVSAAASQSERSRGQSLTRSKGDANTATAAIVAAALSEKNKFNRNQLQQVIPKAKSRSFHDGSKNSSLQHHHRKDNSRPTSQFRRMSSRSKSPQRSTPSAGRRKSVHAVPRFDIDASVGSHSSASSTFSAYDRRIAENFDAAVASSAGSRRSSTKDASSSDMALCEKGKDSCNALLDNDGCCALHPFIQLKMKLPSGKWRTLTQSCVVCREEDRSGCVTASKMSATNKYHHPRSNEGDISRPKFEKRERNTRASSSVMETCESEECSLTPSFLEEDTEGPSSCCKPKTPCDDNSSRGSVNSQMEHKTKTSVAGSSKADLPPLEVSFPNKVSSFDEESLKSKHSLDLSRHSAHTSEQNDAKSVKSNTTSCRNHSNDQDDMKSVRSSATAKRRCGIEVDDSKSVTSSATVRRKRISTKSTIDMLLVDSVVESAMQKIKSMEVMPKSPEPKLQVKPSIETAPVVSRSNPPPPPPPRTQSSKNTNTKVSHNSSNNGSSNHSSSQRPPPPPPPPRKISPAQQATSPNDTVDNSWSMNVLNPDPEPELQNDFDLVVSEGDEMLPPFEQVEVAGMDAAAFPQHNASPAVNVPAKDWKSYCVTSYGREGKDSKGKRRIFGRNSAKNVNEREAIRSVRQMPFTDQFGDYGLYTGQVNEDGRPDGKGSMKYDNGVFYEGAWTNGGQDQKAAMQYERIRGGFTSWQGRGSAQTKGGSVLPWNARKNDAVDPNKKIHVRGMEWTDVNGDSGRYTGEVNVSELPHGFGVMKYDFGLIAEGEWNNGVLKENPQDRMMAAVTAPPLSSGRSVGAGVMSIAPGMSVGSGAHGFNAAASVLGSVVGSASVMGVGMPVGMPVGPAAAAYTTYGCMNPMMMGAPANFAMMAQQNAMLKNQGALGVYGGGSVYSSGSAYGQPQMQGTQGQTSGNGGPPISEIKIN